MGRAWLSGSWPAEGFAELVEKPLDPIELCGNGIPP